MAARRFGFSIQVIHPNGAPAPVGWRRAKRKAVDAAEEANRVTGLEVRVWDTKAARPVKTIAAREEEPANA